MEAEKIYKYLPVGIAWLISNLPLSVQSGINEIRLRRGGVCTVSLADENIVIRDTSGAYICTDADIDETLGYISRSSMYAFDEAVKNGYIPLEGGGRAGICGDAVLQNGEIRTFGSINSVCLRVPRFIKSAAAALDGYYRANGICGTIVFSPPAMGKTTYLKSIASLLSCRIRVGIADERYELSGGKYVMSDVLTGMPKAKAIELLTRTMSPQVIICDEISPAEAQAVQSVQNSGCVLIASCHAISAEQALRKDFVKEMIKSGIFSIGVRLFYENGFKSEILPL